MMNKKQIWYIWKWNVDYRTRITAIKVINIYIAEMDGWEVQG